MSKLEGETYRERMDAIRARHLAANALAPKEWKSDDTPVHRLDLTMSVKRGPLDKRTEQRMLRRPPAWS